MECKEKAKHGQSERVKKTAQQEIREEKNNSEQRAMSLILPFTAYG